MVTAKGLDEWVCIILDYIGYLTLQVFADTVSEGLFINLMY